MNKIDNISLFLQALNLQLLFWDFNNADLMSELQRQDSEYLDKIMKQNQEILTLLRKEENNGRKDN